MDLVLQGGGLRGAFSAGVLKALHDRGIRFDNIIGVSVGALNAAYFVSGQLERLLRIWRDHVPRGHLVNYANVLRRKPILDLEYLVDGVLTHDEPLNTERATTGQQKLSIVVTDLNTQHPRAVIPTPHNILRLLKASSALPIAYNKIVDVDGEQYSDGAITSPFPLDIGPRRGSSAPALAILTRPLASPRKRESWLQNLFVRLLTPAPVRPHVLRQAHTYNEQFDAVRRQSDARTIRVIEPPDDLRITRLSTAADVIDEALEAGERAVRRFVSDHADWLEPRPRDGREGS